MSDHDERVEVVARARYARLMRAATFFQSYEELAADLRKEAREDVEVLDAYDREQREGWTDIQADPDSSKDSELSEEERERVHAAFRVAGISTSYDRMDQVGSVIVAFVRQEGDEHWVTTAAGVRVRVRGEDRQGDWRCWDCGVTYPDHDCPRDAERSEEHADALKCLGERVYGSAWTSASTLVAQAIEMLDAASAENARLRERLDEQLKAANRRYVEGRERDQAENTRLRERLTALEADRDETAEVCRRLCERVEELEGLLARAREVIRRGEIRLDADCSPKSPLVREIDAALAPYASASEQPRPSMSETTGESE